VLIATCSQKLFAPKCHYCETAIVDSRYITIDDPALGHRYYHELHFFCGECGDPFLDPSKSSSAGTEFNKGADSKQESDDLTKEFIINGKHAFCVECDVKLHRPKCAGCRKPIRDEALGAMGAKWHKECFCCAVSVVSLERQIDFITRVKG
jgi:paxillin